MKATLRVGPVEAELGRKNFGNLVVLDMPGYSLQIPILLINGFKEGPTICLTGGVHGCEYCGTESILRLYSLIDPSEISGNVIAIPVVNTMGFQARVPSVNPIDGINLNRVFPGDLAGSTSSILAHVLFTEIISKCNYVIDFHGGDLNEENIDFIVVNYTGTPKVDDVSMSVGRCFNTKFIWLKGSSDRGLKSEGDLCGAANKIGIPGIITEAGHSGKIQEDSVRFLVNGTLNCLKHLKMISGSPSYADPRIIKAQHPVRTKNAGFFTQSKRLGDIVVKGETIGQVRNLFGQVVEDLQSPVDGVLDFLMFNASVLPGNTLLVVGEI